MINLPFNNKLTLVGPLGSLILSFGGSDVIHRDRNSFFFLSKSSYSTFINFFFKQTTQLITGIFLELALVGLGFRILKLNGILLLKVGHAHYVKVVVPYNLHVIAYKKRVLVFGVTISSVKQFAAVLSAFRKPDVYKNKGIQLLGKSFRLKLGKQK